MNRSLIAAFTVHGKPEGQARPRMNKKTGHVYSPDNKAFKERVVNAYVEAGLPKWEDNDEIRPVWVSVVAYFAPPKSWSRKRAQTTLGRPYLQTPDADNIFKAVADALNKLAYGDDACVDGEIRRLWGEPARTEITIAQLGE